MSECFVALYSGPRDDTFVTPYASFASRARAEMVPEHFVQNSLDNAKSSDHLLWLCTRNCGVTASSCLIQTS
eukprot:6143053-Pleurochrysis_carterae.AAC.1